MGAGTLLLLTLFGSPGITFMSVLIWLALSNARASAVGRAPVTNTAGTIFIAAVVAGTIGGLITTAVFVYLEAHGAVIPL